MNFVCKEYTISQRKTKSKMTEPFPQLLWSKNYDGDWGIEKVGRWGSDWVGVGDKTYWKQYRKEKREYDKKYKNTEWADKTPCPPEFKKRIKVITKKTYWDKLSEELRKDVLFTWKMVELNQSINGLN